MSLTIVITVAVLLSIAFHFIGVYAGAKKIVWLVIVLFWAAGINLAMSEIKPNGYKEIESMKGQYSDTDQLIQDAGEEVSLYEMLAIKKSYNLNKKNSK
ncbi:MAG: hypothetical protein WCY51_01085 [Sulfurimonas sp.]|uniref:hypothetical protein n=1 Tax=Sulfurimonas sp. TaxID=2022749 RepID=UPI0025DB8C08|nr:hypothetical protein [Sulfurimonas sp.]MCK9454964.1 hypothetical protein [Sulfurimonas sp.]